MRQPPYNIRFAKKLGLDLITPMLDKDPGSFMFAENYELLSSGGPRRCDGYERDDGRGLPSEASFYEVSFDEGVHEPFKDDVLKGVTSGTQATALDNPDRTAGIWGRPSPYQPYGSIPMFAGSGFVDNEIVRLLPAPDSAGFDGSTYLARGADLTGSADGKKFCLAVPVFMDTTGSAEDWIIGNLTTRFAIYVGTDKQVHVEASNAAGTVILDMYTAGLAMAIDEWHTVIVDVDLSDPAKRAIVVDGDLQPLVIDVQAVDDIDFTRTNWYIGADTGSASASFSGAQSYLWFDFSYIGVLDTSLGVINAANLAKLYNVNSLVPADLGATGQNPTGSDPVIFLNGDETDYGDNLGTGGAFTVTGALTVHASGPSDVFKVDGAPVENSADTDALYDTYIQASMELQRALIQKVPGSGIPYPWVYNDTLWAFRTNTGETAMELYKETSSGWSLQSLGSYLKFKPITSMAEITEGDTITGASSSATAVVKRVAVRIGGWTTDDAYGHLAIDTIVGTFTDGENLEVSAANMAKADGSQVANTISPNGRFEFDNDNFYGHSGKERMYGANGVDFSFEWDATTYMPVFTGMTTDTPTHISVHKKHLFLVFANGSLQNSNLADPLGWTLVLGANEIGTGQDISGLLGAEQIMIVGNRHRTNILYGSDAATWDFQPLKMNVGGLEWSYQMINEGIFLDDRGIQTMSTTQRYGDFTADTISKYVQPLIKELKAQGVTDSVVSRKKNQYRLFFSDKRALIMSFADNKIRGFTIFRYPIVVRNVISGEVSGVERLYFGSDDGYVYRMDSGNNFDGAAVEAAIRFPYHDYRSRARSKNFKGVRFDLEGGQSNATIQISVDFNFGAPDVAGDVFADDITVNAGGGYWNIDRWNEFKWSAQPVIDGYAEIRGDGWNMSLSIYSKDIYADPHTFNSMDVEYSYRKSVRRSVEDAIVTPVPGAILTESGGYLLTEDGGKLLIES